MAHPTNKRILLIATGGTIVCSDDGGGLRPRLSVNQLLNAIQPPLSGLEVTGTTLMNIDSSNMVPACWLQMAGAVLEQYEQYDGFVITHGTDTMAYSAGALSYLLRGLDKPVILTGAQYSVEDSWSDGVQNLHDALLLAAEPLHGVLVVFDGRVINGTRAVKTKTHSYDAFESVNYPLLAEVKHNRIRYNRDVARLFRALPDRTDEQQKEQTSSHTCPVRLEENIIVLRLFPGLQPRIFDYIRDNFRGVIIESYGTGGISTAILDLASKVEELIDSGLVVAVTTQCLKEGVDLQIYEVGRRLPLDRIIYARDMTTEALVAKMMWAMAMTDDFATIKTLMETPVQGDLLLEKEDFSV